ncbi:MAG: class I SAM-dependent methyltransferase [Anaerolineae bacterium]
MFEADRAALIDVYRRLAGQPDDARRVGWPARWVQWLAFEMLVGIADLRGADVLDVGCGLGDLYAFLAARGGVGAYRGVDLAPDLVAAAQARHPGASFAVVDILVSDLEPADYVLASALFDARTPNSPAVLRAVLRRLFALARCGLAWNIFLEPTAPDQYSEPLGTLTAFCAGLTPYLTVRTDYNLNHATFYLYRHGAFHTPQSRALAGRLYLEPALRRRLAQEPAAVAAEYGLSLRALSFLLGAADVEA